MCRICGRMVKCIFDSMPSRVPKSLRTRKASTFTRSRLDNRVSHHVTSRGLLSTAFNHEPTQRTSPPTFLLPYHSKLHQATINRLTTIPSNSQPFNDTPPPSILSTTQTNQPSATGQVTDLSSPSSESRSKPLVISKSLQELLPILHAQRPHYITAHIHRFPYLVQAGDTVRLPFHMHGVAPGDVLRLNRASLLGSRDYTLKAGTTHTESYDLKRTGEPNYLDERLFEVRARVMGVETGPMMIKEKTKRRNRRVKTVRSKHRYTVLKIMDVKVKSLDELMGGKDVILLES